MDTCEKRAIVNAARKLVDMLLCCGDWEFVDQVIGCVVRADTSALEMRCDD